MTFGSLFSGIGGMDLGLERAGWRCLWQVEVGWYQRAILRKHWPDVPKYRDVHHFPPRRRPPARVDLICGGFPCQDASVANVNGKGIDGEKTGLWREFARIIGELRPRFVLMENVPGLLRRGFGRVIGDLAALGYDAEWDCLPASAFGAPHRRDRLWIVAYPAGGGREEEGRIAQAEDGPAGQGSGQSGQLPHGSGRLFEDVADALRTRLDEGRQRPRREARDQPGCGGEDLADADRQRFPLGLQFDGPEIGPGIETPRRDDPDGCGTPVADAQGGGRPADRRPSRQGRHADVCGPILPDPERDRLEGDDHAVSGQGTHGGRRRPADPVVAVAGPRVFGSRPDCGSWLPEPGVRRVADGVPHGVHRLEGLGNAVVPVVAEWFGHRLEEAAS